MMGESPCLQNHRLESLEHLALKIKGMMPGLATMCSLVDSMKIRVLPESNQEGLAGCIEVEWVGNEDQPLFSTLVETDSLPLTDQELKALLIYRKMIELTETVHRLEVEESGYTRKKDPLVEGLEKEWGLKSNTTVAGKGKLSRQELREELNKWEELDAIDRLLPLLYTDSPRTAWIMIERNPDLWRFPELNQYLDAPVQEQTLEWFQQVFPKIRGFLKTKRIAIVKHLGQETSNENNP